MTKTAPTDRRPTMKLRSGVRAGTLKLALSGATQMGLVQPVGPRPAIELDGINAGW
jgi:hypothetical protein